MTNSSNGSRAFQQVYDNNFNPVLDCRNDAFYYGPPPGLCITRPATLVVPLYAPKPTKPMKLAISSFEQMAADEEERVQSMSPVTFCQVDEIHSPKPRRTGMAFPQELQSMVKDEQEMTSPGNLIKLDTLPFADPAIVAVYDSHLDSTTLHPTPRCESPPLWNPFPLLSEASISSFEDNSPTPDPSDAIPGSPELTGEEVEHADASSSDYDTDSSDDSEAFFPRSYKANKQYLPPSRDHTLQDHIEYDKYGGYGYDTEDEERKTGLERWSANVSRYNSSSPLSLEGHEDMTYEETVSNYHMSVSEVDEMEFSNWERVNATDEDDIEPWMDTNPSPTRQRRRGLPPRCYSPESFSSWTDVLPFPYLQPPHSPLLSTRKVTAPDIILDDNADWESQAEASQTDYDSDSDDEDGSWFARSRKGPQAWSWYDPPKGDHRCR